MNFKKIAALLMVACFCAPLPAFAQSDSRNPLDWLKADEERVAEFFRLKPNGQACPDGLANYFGYGVGGMGNFNLNGRINGLPVNQFRGYRQVPQNPELLIQSNDFGHSAAAAVYFREDRLQLSVRSGQTGEMIVTRDAPICVMVTTRVDENFQPTETIKEEPLLAIYRRSKIFGDTYAFDFLMEYRGHISRMRLER